MNLELYSNALAIWQGDKKLDAENYHGSKGFLSNSFIGSFQSCEYSAMLQPVATKKEFNQNFAVGHLVEAYVFNGEAGFDAMLAKYGDDALTKAGKPYKWAEDAKELALSITRHSNVVRLLRSENSQYHQVITFKLYGLDWRGEIDYLNLNKQTEIDLKTTADSFTKKHFNEETRRYDLTFIDKWNYHRQRALYQEGILQQFGVKVQPRILAVSKANKSVKLFKFDDQDRLDYELKQLIPVTDRIKEVISGEALPNKCGECADCIECENVLDEILTSSYCAKI